MGAGGVGAADAPVMTVGTVVILELTGPRASSLTGFPSRPRSPPGALGQLFKTPVVWALGTTDRGDPGHVENPPTQWGH